MKHERGWGLRGALLAAAAGTFAFSGVATAQNAGAASAPGADLRRQLGELAANPTSVSELIETGRTALALGDAEGALGFFTRASELSPQDARVKAGLAAANARTGRPETALMLFSEALAAGAPEAEIAAERGLAYDLLGQPARAQQDYLASLKQREDPEVRRRLALSLAISGQREAALRLIDPQVRQGDRAGARARIMVLALTGDVNGANSAAATFLPASSAQALTPFLSRLASLDPRQMAAAANLGRLPAGSVRSAAAGSAAADPGALAFAGGAGTSSLASRLPIAPAEGIRRRPGAVNTAAASLARNSGPNSARTLASATVPVTAARQGERSKESWTAPAAAASLNASARAAVAEVPVQSLIQPHPYEPLKPFARTGATGPAAGGAGDEPVELAGATGGPRVPQAVVAAPAEEVLLTGGTTLPQAEIAAESQRASAEPVQLAEAQVPVQRVEARIAAPQIDPVDQPSPAGDQVVDGAAANLAVWNGGAAPLRSTPPAASATPGSAPAHRASSRIGFSDVVATVSSLPTEEAASSAPARTEPVARPSNRSSLARETGGRSAAAGTAANPSRIWVQLGMSPNRSGFGYEITRMRRAAPDLFKDRTAYVAPSGGSNRLLVGPFPSAAAARTFVNGLKQKDIDSFAWTSPAGAAVERFAAKR